MKILCVFGKHQYGDPSRGLGTEYTSFIPALHHLGHQVAHFESWNKRHYHDLAGLNGKLLETAQSFRPDIMLTVHMEYELWLEILKINRARGDVATIYQAADDSWKYRVVSRFADKRHHTTGPALTYTMAILQIDDEPLAPGRPHDLSAARPYVWSCQASSQPAIS